MSRSVISLWKVNKEKPILALPELDSAVSKVRFHNQDRAALSSSVNGTIFLYDLNKQKPSHEIKGHRLEVSQLEVDPAPDKAHIVVSGGLDCKVKIWDLRIGKCVLSGKRHSAPIKSISLSTDLLASGDSSGLVSIYDITAGKVCHEWQESTCVNQIKLFYSDTDTDIDNNCAKTRTRTRISVLSENRYINNYSFSSLSEKSYEENQRMSVYKKQEQELQLESYIQSPTQISEFDINHSKNILVCNSYEGSLDFYNINTDIKMKKKTSDTLAEVEATSKNSRVKDLTNGTEHVKLEMFEQLSTSGRVEKLKIYNTSSSTHLMSLHTKQDQLFVSNSNLKVLNLNSNSNYNSSYSEYYEKKIYDQPYKNPKEKEKENNIKDTDTDINSIDNNFKEVESPFKNILEYSIKKEKESIPLSVKEYNESVFHQNYSHEDLYVKNQEIDDNYETDQVSYQDSKPKILVNNFDFNYINKENNKSNLTDNKDQPNKNLKNKYKIYNDHSRKSLNSLGLDTSDINMINNPDTNYNSNKNNKNNILKYFAEPEKGMKAITPVSTKKRNFEQKQLKLKTKFSRLTDITEENDNTKYKKYKDKTNVLSKTTLDESTENENYNIHDNAYNLINNNTNSKYENSVSNPINQNQLNEYNKNGKMSYKLVEKEDYDNLNNNSNNLNYTNQNTVQKLYQQILKGRNEFTYSLIKTKRNLVQISNSYFDNENIIDSICNNIKSKNFNHILSFAESVYIILEMTENENYSNISIDNADSVIYYLLRREHTFDFDNGCNYMPQALQALSNIFSRYLGSIIDVLRFGSPDLVSGKQAMRYEKCKSIYRIVCEHKVKIEQIRNNVENAYLLQMWDWFVSKVDSLNVK